MDKVVLVTGASSGIGAETARRFAAAGWTVWGLSRSGGAPDGVAPLICDVTEPAAVAEAVRTLLAASGRLDLLINCAGFGISGAAELTDEADSLRQMQVNLHGAAAVCRACLPALRQSRGMILNVSSVAGALPIPFQTWYSVSKAAVNAYSAALANEVRPFGVRVCAVMPGDIRTGFTAARRKLADETGLYAGRVERSVSRMERDEQNGMPPSAVAGKLFRLASRRRVPPVCTVGAGYSFLVWLARHLPPRLTNRVLYALYAK